MTSIDYLYGADTADNLDFEEHTRMILEETDDMFMPSI